MIDLYRQNRRGVSVVDRIDAFGDCWEWLGRLSSGYGMVDIGDKALRVHRVVYEALVGPIPHGLELDHLCQNKSCVNPDHLEVVTHSENMRRSKSNRRTGQSQCGKGHSYTDGNLYVDPRGKRECRTCRREAARRFRVKETL